MPTFLKNLLPGARVWIALGLCAGMLLHTGTGHGQANPAPSGTIIEDPAVDCKITEEAKLSIKPAKPLSWNYKELAARKHKETYQTLQKIICSDVNKEVFIESFVEQNKIQKSQKQDDPAPKVTDLLTIISSRAKNPYNINLTYDKSIENLPIDAHMTAISKMTLCEAYKWLISQYPLEDVGYVLDDKKMAYIVYRIGKDTSISISSGSRSVEFYYAPIERILKKDHKLHEKGLSLQTDTQNNTFHLQGPSSIVTAAKELLEQIIGKENKAGGENKMWNQYHSARFSAQEGSGPESAKTSATEGSKSAPPNSPQPSDMSENRNWLSYERELQRLYDQMNSEYFTPASADQKTLIYRMKYLPVSGSDNVFFQGKPVGRADLASTLRSFFPKVVIPPVGSNGKVRDIPPGADTLVILDALTNTVLMRGQKNQLCEIYELLAHQIDLPYELVELNVIILKGVAGTSYNLGMQLGYGHPIGSGTSGVSIAATGQDAAKSTNSLLSTRPGDDFIDKFENVDSLTNAAARFIYRGTRTMLLATLNAMESEAKAQTLFAPTLVALNNQPTKIGNTGSINVIITSKDTGKTDMQVIPTGLNVEILPSIIPLDLPLKDKNARSAGDRQIRLQMKITNTSANLTNNQDYSTDTQSMETNVLIQENTTYVMGGLYSFTNTDQSDGVPVLKEIPLLGRLFKNTLTQQEKKETVFLLTPRVFTSGTLKTERFRWVPGHVSRLKDEMDTTHQPTQSFPASRIDNRATTLREEE
ncbi:MAG: hypothetical protein HQL95_03725 [Magnetococcales bacterium]|nr:hypothetical protein [Magnetococcales bacterium]